MKELKDEIALYVKQREWLQTHPKKAGIIVYPSTFTKTANFIRSEYFKVKHFNRHQKHA